MFLSVFLGKIQFVPFAGNSIGLVWKNLSEKIMVIFYVILDEVHLCLTFCVQGSIIEKILKAKPVNGRE